MDKEKIEKTIEVLVVKAGQACDSGDALRLSQAALNLLHLWREVK